MFPYCSGVIEIGDNNPADFLLACTTRATCDAYQSVILKIQRLSVNSTKQLTTDIGKQNLKKFLSDNSHNGLHLLFSLSWRHPRGFRSSSLGWTCICSGTA